MSSEDRKALVRRFFDEAINKANFESAEKLLAADYVEHPQLPVASTGFSGFKEFVEMLSIAFPDLHVTIEDMVAEGDKVVVRLSISGTHKSTFLGSIPPTGKHVTWRGIDIIRIADGRIVERWGERDLLGLMQQLGVLPP